MENEEYRHYILKTITKANKYFDYFMGLSKDEQLIYANEINYIMREYDISTMEEIDTYIYILFDPSGVSKTCYIGKTTNVEHRYSRHINTFNQAKHKNDWIKSLQNRGVNPELIVINTAPANTLWQIYETFYIAFYKDSGIKLCNGTDGGEGTSGHKHTDESKELMRQAKLGVIQSEETKLARCRQDLLENIEDIVSLYAQGYSILEIGELYDAQHSTIAFHLQKVGINLRSEHYTDRSKEKIRIANIGKIQSSEHIEKRISPLRGQERSDETCQKISNTRKALIADGTIIMSSNRASGQDAGKYRHDVMDNDILNDHSSGMSLRAIGKKYGMEHHAIKQRLIDMGIEFIINTNKDTSNFTFNLEKALELHKSGYSCNKIGKELRCDSKVVKKRLEKAGIIFAPPINSHKNLNDKINRIKELYERNFNYAEIGKMLDTSGNTIKSMLKKAGIID